MELVLMTWNGNNINDGSVYQAWIPQGQRANLSANPVMVNRSSDFPFLSTSVLTPHVLVINVNVLAGQTIHTKRELLKQYFDITDTTRHNLIAKDTADSDRQWYLTGFPVRFVEVNDDKNTFSITLAIETPAWRMVTPVTTTLAATASGQTFATTNIGNIKAKPKFELTPTTTKGAGLLYRRWVPIYNNLDKSFIAPYDITDESATGGGFDTATLTTAKMQADGDDFLVWMDGAFTDRWLQDMDTATTQCWINLNLSPRNEAVTVANIAATGDVASIEFTHTKASLKFLQRLKRAVNKVILIDSEAFTFTEANINLATYKILTPSRAQKGTAEAAHAAPKTARWIEHDIWILYGDSTLSAPDVDDTYKPIFDLSSYNSSWSWTNFFSTSSARPGAWKAEVNSSRTGLSYTFTGPTNTLVNPSTALGLALVGSADFQVQNETGQLDWLFSHPAGIETVTFSGDKYKSGSWPAIVGLQYLLPNAVWFTANNQTEPATTYTWESFGPTTVTFDQDYETIRFAIDGLLSSAISEMALIQFDTVTATFETDNLPTSSIGSELTINFFDFTLTNNTRTEYITCQTPCPVDMKLTIDCENKEAYLADGSRVVVKFSSEREAWLDLNVGSNTIQFDDTGTVAVTINAIHTDRAL